MKNKKNLTIIMLLFAICIMAFMIFIKYEKYEEVYAQQANSKVDIALPLTIYAVVGKEINIYFDNILDDKSEKYQIDVTCDIGKQQSERWTCIPSSAGNYNLTISIYDNNVLINKVTSNIVVKSDDVGNGVNKKCLFIGDSITNNGAYTEELVNLFDNDVMDITLLGTRGTLPNLHEGRSGWTSKLYTTVNEIANEKGVMVPNAFWNPNISAFDFSYYMAQQGYNEIDYVIINLGINDTFNFVDDTALNAELPNILARYKIMVDSIKKYNTNIKIGITVTIPPSQSQDSFGNSYFNGQTQWRYKKNNFIWNKALINNYKDKETQNIYLVPINTNLDTVNNMQVEAVAVNSRNNTQAVKQSNGVHPASSGYYQIADVIYYFIKSFES